MTLLYKEKHCLRCGYIWNSKIHPKKCSKCHSSLWDTPRSYKKQKPSLIANEPPKQLNEVVNGLPKPEFI